MYKDFQSQKKKKKDKNKCREINGKWGEMQNIFVKSRSCQINPAILGFKRQLTEEMCSV